MKHQVPIGLIEHLESVFPTQLPVFKSGTPIEDITYLQGTNTVITYIKSLNDLGDDDEDE
jgi:hypothetical protein